MVGMFEDALARPAASELRRDDRGMIVAPIARRRRGELCAPLVF
jgi:hypothetical protein